MSERMLQQVESYAKSYEPAEGDHPDLQSRVVMYRRAVEGGNKRVIMAHARTLHRFLGNVGVDLSSSSTSSSDGPTKAELQAAAKARGLPTRGNKVELQKAIDEYDAANPQE